MNVANLQIEGLLMAVAAINNLLVHKGMLTVDEIDLALHKAEADITSDERVFEDMSPANRDAVCFPLRLLRTANVVVTYDLPAIRKALRDGSYPLVPTKIVDAMIAALEQAEGPILAYCRSGTRSTLLWALAQAKQGEDPEAIARTAAQAGYDVRPIRSLIDMLSQR